MKINIRTTQNSKKKLTSQWRCCRRSRKRNKLEESLCLGGNESFRGVRVCYVGVFLPSGTTSCCLERLDFKKEKLGYETAIKEISVWHKQNFEANVALPAVSGLRLVLHFDFKSKIKAISVQFKQNSGNQKKSKQRDLHYVSGWWPFRKQEERIKKECSRIK